MGDSFSPSERSQEDSLNSGDGYTSNSSGVFTTTDQNAIQNKNDPRRYANNSYDYNILNAMQYPYLYGPVNRVPPIGDMIDRELNNMQNYALAYPISGEALVKVNPQELYPGKKIYSNSKGVGKAVETAVKVNDETIPAQFYIGNEDLSLGSNHFVELGMCGPDSVPECRGKKRMVYLRNIPTGKIPLLGNISFESITGCDSAVTAGRGTIPGILEDISELAPNNFLGNLSGSGNFGGDTCRRIKLPVGSHIYDPSMKCVLDYDDINTESTLEGRFVKTQQQVYNNCSSGENPNPNISKTWWFEERCSPSWEFAVEVSDIDDSGLGETNLIPVAEPLFDSNLGAKTVEIKSIENFTTSTQQHNMHASQAKPNNMKNKTKSNKSNQQYTNKHAYTLPNIIYLLLLLCIIIIIILYFIQTFVVK